MLNHRVVRTGLLALAATLLIATGLMAQSGGTYTIPAARFGAGTETRMSGGNFDLEGSAGDPSVEASQGGPFFVAGGFWSALYGYRTGVEDTPPVLSPKSFALYPSAPNPFNPRTTISFDLPSTEHVRLRIYNLRGELIRTLVDERRDSGSYLVEWNGRDRNDQSVASGVYLVQVQAGPYSDQHKISLVK